MQAGGEGAPTRNSRSHADGADVASPALSALSASEDGGGSFASWPMMRLPPGAAQFPGSAAAFDSPGLDSSGGSGNRVLGSVGGFGGHGGGLSSGPSSRGGMGGGLAPGGGPGLNTTIESSGGSSNGGGGGVLRLKMRRGSHARSYTSLSEDVVVREAAAAGCSERERERKNG